MTLDGVVEDPDGLEGFDRGGWFAEHAAASLEAWTELETAESMAADALLLGRTSDDWFARRWTDRTTAWADRLNALPKYVVSSTDGPARWTNATVLTGDLSDEVGRVKETHSGEILVYASYHLVRSLLDLGLVDELRVAVFPVVLGAGRRLFSEQDHATGLRLLDVRRLGADLTFLTYAVTR
jgi:dihydrofolate reductase